MARLTLAVQVHVRDGDGVSHAFAAGTVPPAWAAGQITNPRAWADSDFDDLVDEESVTVETFSAGNPLALRSDAPPPEVPPRSGAGSSRQVWADYAAGIGLTISDDLTREQIIEAVTAADVTRA